MLRSHLLADRLADRRPCRLTIDVANHLGPRGVAVGAADHVGPDPVAIGIADHLKPHRITIELGATAHATPPHTPIRR